MTESLPNEVQIAGLLIEPGREGVAKGMHRKDLTESHPVPPMRKPNLDLAGADSTTPVRAEDRTFTARLRLDVKAEVPPKACVQVYRLLDAPLRLDTQRPRLQVQIPEVQADQRPQPDSRTQHEPEHQFVAPGERPAVLADRLEQLIHFRGFHRPRWELLQARVSHKSGRVSGQVVRVDEEPEEHPEGGL
ncbi:MAG TPA: hypothetical protein VFX92_06350 [Candidatus Krumholzibacteria bacterium]|nr:hypothetical protein [Candidatus Krumholzibacteria bacterium]